MYKEEATDWMPLVKGGREFHGRLHKGGNFLVGFWVINWASRQTEEECFRQMGQHKNLLNTWAITLL